ncbi:NUDIX hydrolase [Marivirga arenosa]|uniref:NUDIX hydrolase n=1 Tax=Marivirga arenosa TaxID=3059076 RepID=A0AA49GFC6_9BACT|nr:NUDIX hydrolase [Marivirga sp. ABR2-2]WKK87537.1 NUDIX hydrolase [Marivirga sp. ABR2-2]
MELLNQYLPKTEVEKKYKLKMQKLYQSKGSKAFLRDNLDRHFTASAWIINPISQQVLLLHHKKLNKWLQAGGHADGDENLEKVARKEASEETGHNNLQQISESIFDIDIHTIPERKGIPQHEHYDVRFAYFCHEIEETSINSESNDFQWVELDRIKDLTNEPSILRMVSKTKDIINGI